MEASASGKRRSAFVMAQYRVLVFCTDCGRTHPMRTTLSLTRPEGQLVSFRNRLEIIQGDLIQLKIALESNMRFL